MIQISPFETQGYASYFYAKRKEIIMEFLKAIFGDKYEEFTSIIKAYNDNPENKDKQIKLADLNAGEYVSKKDYDAMETAKTTLEEQLQTATDTLKGFEGVDVEELQGKVKQLTDDMETQKTDYENKIAEMKFGTLIDNAISAAGGKYAKAIRALLDVETLKDSKNQTEDITAAIEACKKDNEYMFGSNEPINNPIAPTGGKVPGVSKNLEDMTYEEYKDYRQGK